MHRQRQDKTGALAEKRRLLAELASRRLASLKLWPSCEQTISRCSTLRSRDRPVAVHSPPSPHRLAAACRPRPAAPSPFSEATTRIRTRRIRRPPGWQRGALPVRAASLAVQRLAGHADLATTHRYADTG